MKIVNYKRFITSMSILILLILSLYGVTFAKNMDNYYVTEYTIEEGDTLWKIALKNKSKETDVRKYIYELKQFNNLETSEIYKGQTILIKKEI